MPKRISDETREKIRQLYIKGMNKSSIAKHFSVSHSIVCKITKDLPKPQVMKKQDEFVYPKIMDRIDNKNVKIKRCPQCGVMVQMPCFACALRKEVIKTSEN